MPIYEYLCKACDYQFDELQKVDAPALLDCPQCAKASLVKLVSAPSFRLKGSGWYETDFKQDKRRNLADDGNVPKENGGENKNKNNESSTSSDGQPAKSSNVSPSKSSDESSVGASSRSSGKSSASSTKDGGSAGSPLGTKSTKSQKSS